ncbi:Rha family transcriptional regulator [Paracidovorax avenae]|uniref:Rha family transcriptional regulator n=1 Tax=Paracidovorax avenae TaxID=80867 RepID=UPI0018654E22|nr:phage regulatory protein/antirepressor Ant [Paracidovorax avenae]
MELVNNTLGHAVTMTSREIAELTGKRHDHVMVDCRKLADFYAETYSPEKAGELVKSSTYVDSTGRSLPCFELGKQASLDLVTGYSLPHRHAVNKRWQELEAMLDQPKVPQTMPEALRLAAEAIEQRDMLALQNKVQAEALAVAEPKARALDLITAGEKAVTMREAAKLLDVKEAQLTGWLHQHGWTYRLNGRWVARQEHIQGGRLVYKEAKFTDQRTGHEVYAPYCHITPKGLAKLAHEFQKQHAKAA